MSPAFTASTLLTALSFVTLSQGFVQYRLLTELTKEHEADEKCQQQNHGGIAVLDTPLKWRLARRMLESENVGAEGVWIGLKYYVAEGTARWSGDVPYIWGNWPSGQPTWSSSSVYVDPTDDYLWKVSSSNPERRVLCAQEVDRMRMIRHGNLWAHLDGASPLMSVAGGAECLEDCGLLCLSAPSCDYIVYQPPSRTCSMYNHANISELLEVYSSSPSAFPIYLVVSP